FLDPTPFFPVLVPTPTGPAFFPGITHPDSPTKPIPRAPPPPPPAPPAPPSPPSPWSNPSAAPLLATATVNVGDRIEAPAGELGSAPGSSYLAGYILQTNGNSFNPPAYVDPFANGIVQANPGAIIPVNAIPGHH